MRTVFKSTQNAIKAGYVHIVSIFFLGKLLLAGVLHKEDWLASTLEASVKMAQRNWQSQPKKSDRKPN